MNYRVLENKNPYLDPRSGEYIKDMLTLSYIIPNGLNYILFKVTADYIARPDLICLAHYGTDDYVDIVCKFNGISNPYELNEGDILALPEVADMARFIYSMDDIQQTFETKDNSKPTPKAKKEKRKANEAVVGDKRFRIDKESRVVVY